MIVRLLKRFLHLNNMSEKRQEEANHAAALVSLTRLELDMLRTQAKELIKKKHYDY